MMKHLVLLVALTAVGCGSSPVTPTPPTPACQTNNTAEITLANASPNNLSFDVLIDNIGRGTIAPGGNVGPVTLTAGVPHTIESRVATTTITACTSTSSFAPCSTQTLTCRF